MVTLLHRMLEIPVVFELQQKFCNDYENVTEEFSELLTPSGLRILDVGCSTGTCASQVIDMKRQRYTGIELHPGYAATAAKRFPDGRFLQMDARSMTFEDGSFDLAMYVGVLHHMDDETARACLSETRRVLRPGGHLMVAEPVFTKDMWLSTMFLSMDRGKHIRTDDGYHALFGGYQLQRERHFRLSLHRFASFILQPES
jgi:ubiquinone/menaquinone biosynthesis C-methylase UbiE